jgi:hypothetical protein
MAREMGRKTRAQTMQNYDPVANGNPQSSRGSQEQRDKGGQDTQAALDGLRVRLDAVSATVVRLERGSQEWQWSSQAERELLDLFRGEDAAEFTVTISCAKGRWFVVTRSPGLAGASAGIGGQGASFPEAWHRQDPLWS